MSLICLTFLCLLGKTGFGSEYLNTGLCPVLKLLPLKLKLVESTLSSSEETPGQKNWLDVERAGTVTLFDVLASSRDGVAFNFAPNVAYFLI
jgi:hypothetical protein